MSVGATASVLLTQKKVSVEWDTGEVADDKPVLVTTNFKITNEATIQQVYDAIYSLGAFSDYAIYDITIETKESLSPID